MKPKLRAGFLPSLCSGKQLRDQPAFGHNRSVMVSSALWKSVFWPQESNDGKFYHRFSS